MKNYDNQIWFNDDLPVQKTLKLHNMRIVVKAVFHEDNKYCPQIFLDE